MSHIARIVIMNRRSKRIVLGVVLTLCASGVLGLFLLENTDLRRSEWKIRDSLLDQTPVGTDVKMVMTFIRNQPKWSSIKYNDEFGYDDDRHREVGSKSIRVVLGRYKSHFPLWFGAPVTVTAYWGFDQDGKLIDVYVEKSTDSL